MAKIVIAAFGSRGDVAPLTGIGVRLQQAGHQVSMTAPAIFRELITGCGLRHLPHDLTVDTGAPRSGDRVDLPDVNPLILLMGFWSPAAMRRFGRTLLSALQDEPMDALLLSPHAEFAGHPLAEARNIPSIGVRLQPISATSEFPPAFLGSWSLGPLGNRAASRLGAAAISRLYANNVAHYRASLGLPKRSAGKLRHDRTASQWPVLYGYSPSVVPRPTDWRPGLDPVGYWWPARPDNWQPPATVVSFLESGPPPVFLTFGSLPMRGQEVARLSELVPAALRKAGVRGIVQAGWAGLNATATASSDDLLTIGELPHDWLFDKVAAVVHACGAGTTAAGLRAGIPAVAVPGPIGDQPFWAKRLHELGVSPTILSPRRLTVDNLAAAIKAALTNPTHRDRAEHLAARIAEEDGASQALAAVERLVRAG